MVMSKLSAQSKCCFPLVLLLIRVCVLIQLLPLAMAFHTTSSTTTTISNRWIVNHLMMRRQNNNFLDNLLSRNKKDNDAIVSRLKENIRSISEGTDNGISATDSQREEIAALVQELESLNPTTKLSLDEKLNGSWNLIYTTNSGSSAGKLGPFVGNVEQRICLPQDEYINFVRLWGLEGALTATWDVLSNDTWQVKFQTLHFKLLGLPVLQTNLEAQGIWRKVYLDDDFRILYAKSSNIVDAKENIYILAKQQK